jgi:hypothetical protein
MNIKKWIAQLSCAAVAAWLPSPAQSQDTTFQQGCVTWHLRPGWNAVGIPILRPAFLHGTIQDVESGNKKMLVTSLLPLPASFSNATPSFLEVLSCPRDPLLVGERFELAEHLLTQKGGKISVSIEDSALNTLPHLPISLVDATYAIRPHWTLQSALENHNRQPILNSGKTAGSADTVSMPHHVLYPDNFRWFHSPAFRGRQAGFQSTFPGVSPMDPVIPPGQGLLMFRQGPALRHVLAGEARQSLFRRPLRKGGNFVSLGHLSPGSFVKLLMNPENGFTLSSGAKSLDRISILHRDVWDSFTLRIGPLGLAEWGSQGVAYPAGLQASSFLAPGVAIRIEKATDDPEFAIPYIP